MTASPCWLIRMRLVGRGSKTPKNIHNGFPSFTVFSLSHRGRGQKVVDGQWPWSLLALFRQLANCKMPLKRKRVGLQREHRYLVMWNSNQRIRLIMSRRSNVEVNRVDFAEMVTLCEILDSLFASHRLQRLNLGGKSQKIWRSILA